MSNAGFFYTDITPERPAYMGGYFARTAPSEGVCDPLMLRIAALEDECGKRAVIVTADMFAWPRAFSERIRKWADPLPLIINASHTHCAPVLEPHRSVSEWKVDQEYVDMLEAKVKHGINCAFADLHPVRIEFGSSDIGFGVNRRRKNELGQVEMRPNPDGLYNATIPVITFYRDGTLEALLYSCNCHPTSRGGQLISADYPGAVARHLPVPGIFVQGACGSAKPAFFRDCDKTYFAAATTETLDAMGADIANSIMELVHSGKQRELKLELSGCGTDFELPLDISQLSASVQNWRKIIDDPASWPHERHGAAWFIADYEAGTLPDCCDMRLDCLKVAENVRIVALSGEITAEAAQLIQAFYPHETVMVWGHSPYTAAYIPSAAMLPERGYEACDSQQYYFLPVPFSAEIDDVIRHQLKP